MNDSLERERKKTNKERERKKHRKKEKMKKKEGLMIKLWKVGEQGQK